MSYYDNTPESLSDLIFAILGSARSTRRLNLILSERKIRKYKKGSVEVALSRLKKKGFVENSTSGWSMTKTGKTKFKNIQQLSYIASPFKADSAQNTILSFDVPETDRILRNWLRNQLKIFGYKMLQQSLWIGPRSLPQKFLKRLVDLKIRKNVKIFRIKT